MIPDTDDIDFGDARQGVKNIIGGAASFAVVGARLVAGSVYGRRVSWIVDVGSDFPQETLAAIQSWNTDCVIREDPSRLTTKAWNGYHPNEKRGTSVLCQYGTGSTWRDPCKNNTDSRLQVSYSKIETGASYAF